MKKHEIFKPLIDFEKQIDNAFLRYNLKRKEDKREKRSLIEKKLVLNLRRYGKIVGK